MSIRIIIIFFFFQTILSSCSNIQDSQKIGAIFGALSGSAISSKIGKGTGKNISMAAGPLVGSLIGKSLAMKLYKSDIDLISSKTSETLNKDEINNEISWKNPETGNSGTIEATKDFKYKNKNCREVKQVIKTKNKINEKYNIACEQADGSWKISTIN